MKNFAWIPNFLTILRVVLLFPALYLLHTESSLAGFSLLAFAFLTDFLDGALARRYSWTSHLGAILDPVADKLAGLLLLGYFSFLGALPGLYMGLVAFRDLSQLLAIPVLILYKRRQFYVRPKFIPKLGTALKFFLILVLVFSKILPELSPWSALPIQIILILSSLCEVQILWNFIPRFLAIYQGRHDCFE